MSRVECAAARRSSWQLLDLDALAAGVRLSFGSLGLGECAVALQVVRRANEQGDLFDGLSGAGHAHTVDPTADGPENSSAMSDRAANLTPVSTLIGRPFGPSWRYQSPLGR